VVGSSAVQSPRRRLEAQARHQPLFDSRHQRRNQPPLLEPLLEVARAVEFVEQPTLFERLRIVVQRVVAAPCTERRVSRFGGEHAGLDRGVAALDARRVQRPGFAADQRAAREYELGQAQDAARGDGARAVGDALAALERLADRGVRLPALEFLERAEPRVRVVQSDDKAERDLVLRRVVEERAAVGVAVERPAGGVHHQARLMLRRGDFPQFFQTDAVTLRVPAGVERVARNDLLAEVAAGAFGEDGVARVQLHAELKAVVRLAVLADAHVAGGHALHRAVRVVKHFGSGKTGEDVDTEAFRLLRHPAHDAPQADDVVAVVLEAVGEDEFWGRSRSGFAQEQELVRSDFLVQRRAEFAPVREQLGNRLRVHDRARQDVRARLGPLLENDDRDLLALQSGELLEADRAREAGRPRADDHDVVFHRLARAVLFEDVLWEHGEHLGALHVSVRLSQPRCGLMDNRPACAGAFYRGTSQGTSFPREQVS
jgi:hypothetical protein